MNFVHIENKKGISWIVEKAAGHHKEPVDIHGGDKSLAPLFIQEFQITGALPYSSATRSDFFLENLRPGVVGSLASRASSRLSAESTAWKFVSIL